MIQKRPKHDPLAIRKAVKYFGSIQELANYIGVHRVTVSKWIALKWSPCPQSCLNIERETKGHVTKEEICPHKQWDKIITKK